MSRSRSAFLPFCFAAVALLAAGTASAGPGKARKVVPKQISADAVVVEGQTLLPLADLAKAAGCTLTPAKGEAKAYEGWPCKPGALLVLDVEALRAAAKATLSSGSGPETPGTKVAFNPQPDPPHELRFDGIVASRAVVMHAGVAHISLGEVARLMGGKLQRKGKRTWISVPADVDAPLELAGQSAQKLSAPASR